MNNKSIIRRVESMNLETDEDTEGLPVLGIFLKEMLNKEVCFLFFMILFNGFDLDEIVILGCSTK